MDIYIHRYGNDLGPYSPQEVQNRLTSGEFNITDLAWHDGAAEWVPLHTIGGINRLPPSPVTNFELVHVAAPASRQVQKAQPLAPAAANMAACPFCAEPIQPSAKKCRHCGETLDVAMRAVEEIRRAGFEKQLHSNVVVNVAVSGSEQRREFPHVMHLVVTVLTGFLWFPIWILHYLFRDRSYYN